MAKTKFPALAVIILLIGLAWLFNDIGYLTIDIPWIPVIVIVLAIGMIFNRFAD